MAEPDAQLDPETIATLLGRATQDPASLERLIPAVYDQLRALAGSYMGRQASGDTLQPTALVHEAFVRLLGTTRVEYESRAHFFAVAANAMRFVLADAARRRRAEKRGDGWHRVTLSGIGTDAGDRVYDALDVDEALTELAALNERQARVVELRFFGGLTVEQIARVLDAGKRTIDTDWKFARAWLRGRLERGS
jgi:RNA polymerase sigma factor (TIGR02999 family)